jgi:hypothetical protein
LLPVALVIFHFPSQKDRLDQLELSIQNVQNMAFLREKRQVVNIALQSHFREADHFYIDKYIESIPLLEPEIESLQKIVNNPNFTEDENIKKRLEFLTGPGNSLSFSEGVVQSTPNFQETTETLVHPVEVNITDVQNILSKIEGIHAGPYAPSPGRPQLIILDFKLEKKSVSEKNEIFLLNLKLLKREFL